MTHKCSKYIRLLQYSQNMQAWSKTLENHKQVLFRAFLPLIYFTLDFSNLHFLHLHRITTLCVNVHATGFSFRAFDALYTKRLVDRLFCFRWTTLRQWQRESAVHTVANVISDITRRCILYTENQHCTRPWKTRESKLPSEKEVLKLFKDLYVPSGFRHHIKT